MSSVIQQGLMITLIGMGLVFLVIIFLWWLMGLLVKVTTKAEVSVEEPEPAAISETRVPEMAAIEQLRRAAAAAVSVGLTIEARSARRRQVKTQADGGMSPWQSVHRAQQLEQHNRRG
ncbi:MAG: OadG family protein [Brevefilum sp.]|nr:OadG family protein [Brevefilum sp.]